MQGAIVEVAGKRVVATVVPDGDRTPDEWAEYVKEALGRGVAALLESGRRITAAHADYKANKTTKWSGWGWNDWCRQKLQCGRSWVSQLECSAKFINDELSANLPPDTNSLYTLARLNRDAPEAFDAAIADGTINPGMSRGQAKELLEEHTKPKRIPAQISDDSPPVAGQAWKLGNHLLYCADSSTWQSPLDQPARMAFADPPYGLTNAHWDSELYWEHDWLVDAADFVFVTPGIRNTKRFQPVMPYHWTLTYWMSNSMTHGPVGFSNVQHIELYSRLGSVKVGAGDWFQDAMGSGTVDATETRNHRGQKPISMLVWLLEKFTDPGDWVIDPFLGSGTTLLAAEKTGRFCLGIEKDPDYCQLIIRAWEQQTGSKAETIDGG